MEKCCVFCQIVAGEQCADVLYEDERVMAFLDIAPITKGHSLVIPREHHHSLNEIPSAVLTRMMEVASRIGPASMRVMDGDGFNIMAAVGRCAGQIVPHAHLHVVPRHPADGVVMPTGSSTYENENEKHDIAQKLRWRVNGDEC